MKHKNKRGFTLVEIICVLVILAILAASAIPTMLGFVEDAKGKAIVADARAVYLAAQTTVIEQYSLNTANYQERAKTFRDNGKPRGRVSTNMLSIMQNNGSFSADADVDAAIAKAVLAKLDSSNKNTATYKFNNSTNPMGITAENYESRFHQPGIIISYTPEGKIDFVEYGYKGYLVRIDSKGCTTTKNGRFSNVPI